MKKNLELEEKRLDIDVLDRGFVDLLADYLEDRDKLVGQVALIKVRDGLAPLQADRYNQMVANLQEYGHEKGINPQIIAGIWAVIHEHSLASQQVTVE